MSSNNLMSHDEIWDDSELIRMYDESVKGLFPPPQEVGSSSAQQKWKVGDNCMAPWEERLFAAKILSIDNSTKVAKVKFVEYDDEISVDLKELYREDEVDYVDDEEEMEDCEMSTETAEVPAAEQMDAKTSAAPTTTIPQNLEVVKSESLTLPIPKLVPPPAELFSKMGSEGEVTNNMMISWYMSGYHTGYYQAVQDIKNGKLRL